LPSVRVESLLQAKEAGLALELVAGRAGLDRRITGPRIQKPGLALAGSIPPTCTRSGCRCSG
jgi:HPr kinase/phosphorylase